MEYYHDLVTQKSWLELQKLKQMFDKYPIKQPMKNYLPIIILILFGVFFVFPSGGR